VIVEIEPSCASAYEAAPFEPPTPASETSRWPLPVEVEAERRAAGRDVECLRVDEKAVLADEEGVDPVRAPSGDDELLAVA
jgi:hypothetical protein